jgi:hypothetical protein
MRYTVHSETGVREMRQAGRDREIERLCVDELIEAAAIFRDV